MATQANIELPPGFDEMSREEQIAYAQKLWEYIAPRPEEVPVPSWQIEAVRERIRQHRQNPSTTSSWEDVRERMTSKFG
jgi:putative addiction module component (TIGR02574 family)